jgi:uncharacterized membrane protein HdeD (DUF308 family)
VASVVVVIADPARLWAPVLVRGLLSVVFGVLALLWPGLTVLALALLFGAWALSTGVSSLVAAVRAIRAHADVWQWLSALGIGLLGIAAAVTAVLWPGITVLVLTVLVATLLIVGGAAEVVFAVRVRKQINGEWLLIVVGVLAVLTGLAILIWPQPGVLALTMGLGSYAVVTGVLLVVAGLRLRGLARRGEGGAGPQIGAVNGMRHRTR